MDRAINLTLAPKPHKRTARASTPNAHAVQKIRTSFSRLSEKMTECLTDDAGSEVLRRAGSFDI